MTPTPDYYLRVFAVAPAGTVTELRASHAVSAAWDILEDAGIDPERYAPTLFTADQPDSPMTPEQFARKLIRLRRAIQTRVDT